MRRGSSTVTSKLIATLIVMAVTGTLVVVSFVTAPSSATAASAPRPYLTGWFGWWASSDQIQRLIDHSEGVAGEVSIFWWAFAGPDRPLCTYDAGDADSDGQVGDCLESATPWTSPTLTDYRRRLQAAGIDVHASITDLDAARAGQLSAYLATDRRRHIYARQITRWAMAAGVDGVDLDWENFAFNDGSSTWTTTRPRWVAMVRLLARMLREHGMVLSVTVPAGAATFHADGRPVDSTGYWVYDWAAITPHVDRLRLMTYDYSWSSPGPIGPNDWAASVVRSAIAQTGGRYATKIQVGDPQYGKDWVRRDPSDQQGYLTVGDCPRSWEPTRQWTTLIAEQARALARGAGTTPRWSVPAREWTFRYTALTSGRAKVGTPSRWRDRSCHARHEVWFADTRSALARAHLVSDDKLRGITVWNLGTVGARFYERLASYGRVIAPHPTRVRLQATLLADVGSRVAVLARAISQSRPVPGARATLLWRASTSDSWRWRRSGTTNERGWVDFGVVPAVTGQWRVRVSGSWDRSPGISTSESVTRMAYAVTLTASDPVITRRTAARLIAAVQPASAEIAVLQRRTRTGWIGIGEQPIGRRGLARWRVGPDRSTTYRVVIPGTRQHARGSSPPLRVRVTP